MDLFEPGISAPPPPKTQAERQRVMHTRMRRQILYGLHEGLVANQLVRSIGTTRAIATRIVDLTANPGKYTADLMSALYREIPEVVPPVGGEDTAAAVLEAGWWQLAATNQRDVIALNDGFVRVSVDRETRVPSFQIVPPDMVEVTSNPVAPSQPLALKEWIPDPDDAGKWVHLECDPRIRQYRAVTPEGVDVTERVLGEASFSGDNYPFIVDGVPVLPYIAYHAHESGYALNPYQGREIWGGTLQLCVYYSFYGHSLLQASWAQTVTVGLRPMGGELDETGKRRDVIADPAVALMFEPSEEGGGSPSISKLSPSTDLGGLFSSIKQYEQRLVESALSTVGVSRRDSDVRSAMSLAVSRDAQREAQRAYEPSFKRSDLKLLKLVAGLRGEPTEGWDIRYRSLPRDAVELDSELARAEKMLAMGLIDKPSVYQALYPGTSRERAEAMLRSIEGKLVGQPATIAPPMESAPSAAAASPINLTSTDIASIVTVDEARQSQGLPPVGGATGKLTVAEYQAKNASVIAAAANAVSGSVS